LVIAIIFSAGCASVPVATNDPSLSGKDPKNRHTHPASVVFKRHTKRDIQAMLNVEGGEVPGIDYDDLNDFFLQNYADRPYRLTPAEHAVASGLDIAGYVCGAVAGLVILGVVDKNWRPF
jgi:hypothetical protein